MNRRQAVMWTLKKKFALIASLQIILAVSITLLISYSYFYATLVEKYRDTASQTVNKVMDDFDSYINDIDKMSLTFHYTREINDFFNQRFLPADDESTIKQKIQVYINALIDMKHGVGGIDLIRNDNQYVSSSYTGGRWIQVINDSGDRLKEWKNILSFNRYIITARKIKNSSEYMISYARRFLNLNIADEDLGIIVININSEVFNGLLSHLTESSIGNAYIIDSNGTILYCENKPQIGEKIHVVESISSDLLNGSEGSKLLSSDTGHKNLVTYKKSGKTDWMLVSIIPWNSLMMNLDKMRDAILVMGLVLMALSSLLAYFFAFRITNPLNLLICRMEKVREGNFNEVKIDTVPKGEIGQLTSVFNKMVADIRQLINKVFEEQRQKRHAEFKALQSQINPHFLNNTLSSLIWLVSSDRKQESIEIISSLSDLMKNSFQDNKEIIPVKREFEHLMNYVKIQRIRYKSKLHVKFDIDDSLLDYYMPKFLLQPLVENAIIHGISPRKSGGVVKITAHKKNGLLVFKVIDNGVGMNLHTIETIMQTAPGKKQSYGVYNVNSRIKLQYGETYGLKFLSKPGKGTVAVIRIPLDSMGGEGFV